MGDTPLAYAYFIMQTLESASNQSEFIVKQCHTLMVIHNQKPINDGLLIVDNIKSMADAPQRACGNFSLLMSCAG